MIILLLLYHIIHLWIPIKNDNTPIPTATIAVTSLTTIKPIIIYLKINSAVHPIPRKTIYLHRELHGQRLQIHPCQIAEITRLMELHPRIRKRVFTTKHLFGIPRTFRILSVPGGIQHEKKHRSDDHEETLFERWRTFIDWHDLQL